MSPLLGALGDSSEYAYRGTLDDIPADFSLVNVTGVEPGIAYTTGPIQINGINNAIKVSVSAGASIAINSGIFTSGSGLVRDGQTIAVSIPTTSGTDSDFNKIYNTTLIVGRISKQWSIVTREKDSTPDAFTFINSVNQELGITSTSNTITIFGLDSTLPSNASITSGIGSFRKNGGSPGTADTVGNGDTLEIVLDAPLNYSTTNSTSVTVGEYTTSYSVSTRAADTTVNQFAFNNFTNVGLSSSFDSNSITLSGADNNTAVAPVPLTATVSGGFLKVVRDSTTVRDFSASSATVYNGDILTLRVNSSPSYSTSTSASLSITGTNTPVGVASTFSVTTRLIISDTIPSQFTFVDKTGQGRNIATISDPITIVGMTTHADDFATAFISTSTDGGEFRVTRGGSVVRDFSSSGYQVRNNDVINLRLTTSPASNGSVQAKFNVSGSDNTDIDNIITQTISDTWLVQSAVRNCPLVAPTLTSVSKVEPSSLQSVTFIPTSYDSDCGVVVNVSNANSYLNVNGVTGNNITVLPGVACTIFMTAGTFSETRTTTVTLTANNNIPSPTSTSSTWSVTTRASNDPTVTLTANPSIVSCNESTTLTWSSTNTVSLTTNGFTGIGTAGSVSVGPLKQNSTYSITATGPDGTTSTSSASVFVATTADANLDVSSTSVEYNGSVTLFWATSNASSVISNFGVTATSGSITLNNLTSSRTYTLRAVSNSGCGDSPTQSVTVNVASCSEDNQSDNYTSGVTLNYRYANPGNGFDYYFTGLSGSNINSASRSAQNINGSRVWDGNSVDSTTSEYFQVPDGVYQIYAICRGGGGGGGGGGGLFGGGGGGGGGQAFGTIYTSPGTLYIIRYGPGGPGGPSGGAGNTPNNGGTGAFGTQGNGAVIQDQNGNDILRGRGGYGGGRNYSGAGGGSYDPYTNPSGFTNVNNTGNGGTNEGSRGEFPSVCTGGNGGGNYRSGGRGGNCQQVGGGGTGSWIYISWNVSIEGASWNTLIASINNQYRSSFNRPASANEMDYWIGQYTSYNYSTVSELTQSISGSGAYRSSSGAISYCGSRL
jgi:hypothetical protein